MFYATAAEALSTVQGEIEELSVAAEGEYRYVAISPPLALPCLTVRTPRRTSRDH